MDKLRLPAAKLLFFASELFKNKEITEAEKIKFKGFFKRTHYYQKRVYLQLSRRLLQR
jgi:hypothetical protein